MSLLNRKTSCFVLICTIAAQLAVALFILGDAWYTRKTGQEILLKAQPVDPRSLFRGNYARIGYDISQIPKTEFPAGFKPRPNETVYVLLKKDNAGTYVFDSASLELPKTDGSIFLRGRIPKRCHESGQSTVEVCRVHYGIEAFFAPKEKALALERTLRENARARIKVTSAGKAALVDIVPVESS